MTEEQKLITTNGLEKGYRPSGEKQDIHYIVFAGSAEWMQGHYQKPERDLLLIATVISC